MFGGSWSPGFVGDGGRGGGRAAEVDFQAPLPLSPLLKLRFFNCCPPFPVLPLLLYWLLW